MSRIIKTFEEAKIAVVNKQVVDKSKNLSAEYHVNAVANKKPYKKNDYTLTPVEPGKTIPQKAVYLTEIQAKNLNEIGRELMSLAARYEELLAEYQKD